MGQADWHPANTVETNTNGANKRIIAAGCPIPPCPARLGRARSALVLTIIDPEATPLAQQAENSRAFVEAAWRNNPAISPSWWRESLGYSHSKVISAATALPAGVNAQLITKSSVNQPGIVQWGCGPHPAETFGDIFIWQPAQPFNPTSVTTAFQQLERHVLQGRIAGYGIAFNHQITQPLHEWLNLAATAAEQIHQRKKRSALRALLCTADVLHLDILFTPSTHYKQNPVPLLELAARLGLWVTVQPTVWPSDAPPPPTAAAALIQLAEAEQALHQQLQGQWPHQQGKPLFAVLPALLQGQAPWPTPQSATLWLHDVWPSLQTALRELPTSPARETYLHAWQQALPHVETLALHAGQQAALRAMTQLAPKLPATMQSLTPQQQHAMLLAALPGVSSVLTPNSVDVTPLLALPDIPDIGALLA